jgi:ABC-2 type transport system permease protein
MDWNQLGTILWLRWRLTRNQWSRSGQLNVILAIIACLAGLTIGVAGGFAGLFAGIFAMRGVSPSVMLVVWDAIIGSFLFFWMVGIVSEIQRSETIDIGRLLHLPISLRDVFLMNYLASHMSLSIILFLPLMLGLSVGLILGKGWSMILLLPLVFGFVFMITAWTYCLRGWIVRLMVNKRRRRAVIAVMTLIVILISQLPNLFINVINPHKWGRPAAVQQTPANQQTGHSHNNITPVVTSTLLIAHKVVPFLWMANGAMSLAGGNAWPAILGAAGTFLIGGLGLRRAYRSTIHFYQGQEAGKMILRQNKKKKAFTVRRGLIEKRLPGIPDEASVLAMVFFRCLTRAPEIKIGLATNIIMLIIFGGIFFFRHSPAVSNSFKPFIFTGAVVFTFFGMIQLFSNQFGYDREGFRTLVLLPVPRKYILLGKNFALMPIAFGIGFVFLTLTKFAIGASLAVFFAAGLQLAAAFMLLSIAGNLLSVLVPYRIGPGSLKPTKISLTMTVMIFLTHLFFPIFMLLIFLPPALGLLFSSIGIIAAAAVNILFSMILLILLVFFYQLTLRSIGDLLQHREKKILQIVTQQIE